MTQTLADARSLLFVPGNRPERFAKAIASGADAVILDLEDSVPPEEKQAARNGIRDAWGSLAAHRERVIVRINALGAEAWRDDVELASSLPGLAAVMLPKVESQAAVVAVHAALDAAVVLPFIETAIGLREIDEVAAAAGVLRLVLGHFDFMADTGIACGADEEELAPLRFALAVATRVAGLAPAVDGVTVQIDDEAKLRADTLRARRFGFGGKLCIHPRQVAAVHAGFAPSESELAWAKRVVEADAASGGQAVKVDGRMVDRPVVLLARRMLERAAG